MKNLPKHPNLQFLLREAKAMKSAHRSGDTSICGIVGHFDISLHGLSTQEIFDTRFSILDAQRVVARQYGFSSWTRLKKYVQRCWIGRNPADGRLRHSILSRYEELNTLVKEYKSKKGDYKSKYQRYQELSVDTDFLNRAYDHHGWPGPDVVGSDCMEALTYVASNAVYDADFQNRYTQLMGESLSAGGCCEYWYAQLRDRYLVLSNKPTIYGSSFGAYLDDDNNFKLLKYDVVDPENLNKRRAKVGLDSIEHTQRQLAKEARENQWNLHTYEQCMNEQKQLSIDGGYLRQQ